MHLHDRVGTLAYNTIIMIIMIFYFTIIIMSKFQYRPSLSCTYVLYMVMSIPINMLFKYR